MYSFSFSNQISLSKQLNFFFAEVFTHSGAIKNAAGEIKKLESAKRTSRNGAKNAFIEMDAPI